ncbi:MAG: ribosome-recycling factor [Microcystis flos-aquae DF17]|nr:MAG: ribosome-recycling factor [Microcystis flos-aquae DF17]
MWYELIIKLNFPRINILAMAQSLTEPELKQCNTNKLLGTNS